MAATKKKAATRRSKKTNRTASKRPRTRASSKKKSRRKWSGEVMRRSNALDLEESVFKSRSPARIAASLKRSADASKRRKGTSFQSAMSMVTFYINRANDNLPKSRRDVLERVKGELRKAYGRDA